MEDKMLRVTSGLGSLVATRTVREGREGSLFST